jgi:beta-mannosidase
VEKDAEGYKLTIDSKVLLRDVLIQVDRLDPKAFIDDNLITILPGEPRTFLIHSERALTVEQLTRPPVFACANRFGRG